VSRIEEQRDGRAIERAREGLDGRGKAALIEIGSEHDFEAEPLQRLGHIVGVVGRVAQRRRVGIGGISDNQRDPAVRARGGRDRQADDQGTQKNPVRREPPPRIHSKLSRSMDRERCHSGCARASRGTAALFAKARWFPRL
jgi:hypothetical protein